MQLGTIAHEIAHAIGFHHEQSRSDRDDYVTIVYGNIRAGLEGNFVKYQAETESLTYGVPYDTSSIMHYDVLVRPLRHLLLGGSRGRFCYLCMAFVFRLFF